MVVSSASSAITISTSIGVALVGLIIFIGLIVSVLIYALWDRKRRHKHA